MDTNLIPFEGINIRKVWHESEWYFNVSDVIAILTESKDPKAYWRNLKKRLLAESGNQSVSNCYGLKFEAADGKKYNQDAANVEGMFRIIMGIPSPKAEPIRLWLAEQGKRTIDETENPELLTERQIALYKAKGYSDEWIKERIQNIDTRKRLTDEWKNRGVTENKDFSVLTATIAKGTFGMTPSEHAEHKAIGTKNLRDHMTPLELIFTSLGEELTRQQAIKEDAQGFNENHDAAIIGGNIAGESLKNAENKLGIKVVSKDNYLPKSNMPDALPEPNESE